MLINICIFFGCAVLALPPNIVHIVVDDLGYFDLGYKNGVVQTPELDRLVKGGIQLTSYYTFKVCAPARASILTGRYPWSIGYYNVGGYNEGVNLSFSLLPELLKKADYSTIAIGKWHIGGMLEAYTPTFRGFDSYFGYYAAATSSYWYHGGECSGCKGTDFSNSTGKALAPATGENGIYSTHAFTDYAVAKIKSHNKKKPLYMYLAYQATHDAAGGGIQAPLATVNQYPLIINDTYKVQAAAATELDWGVRNVTSALKEAGIWNNTVLVVTSDNGGPLPHTYNWPLRGGKHTYWEGGIRGEAFIHSELLPEKVRGKSWDGLVHTSDWYTTFVTGLAGTPLPSNTGPRPVDGVNIWPALISGGTSPRTEVISQVQNEYWNDTQVIRRGNFKLLIGNPGDSNRIPFPANSKTPITFGKSGGTIEKGTDHATGPGMKDGPYNKSLCKKRPCLFNLKDDITESKDLAGDPQYADLIKNLTAHLKKVAKSAMPFSKIFTKSSDFKAAKEAMCNVITKTGFIEPADFPLGPTPPPTPLGPTPPPTPAPPPTPGSPTPPPTPGPIPSDCEKEMEKICAHSKYPDDKTCRKCCHTNKPDLTKHNCKPEDFASYCGGS